jgi:hypothetical protein
MSEIRKDITAKISSNGVPLGEQIKVDMRSTHTKFHEFSMHRKGDINLSLFSFSEICTMG